MFRGIFGGRKRTVSFIKLWDEVVSAWLLRGRSKSGVVRDSNLYADFSGLYSGDDCVTYMYTLDKFPRVLENSFRKTLRRACGEDVRVSFVTRLEKTGIDWGSMRIKAKLRTWRALDSETKEGDVYSLPSDVDSLSAREWRRDSLEYLTDANVVRKRSLFSVRGIMLISGVRGDEFDRTVSRVLGVCRGMELEITRVMMDLGDYMETYSPFSCTFNDSVYQRSGSVLMTDELLARFTDYSPGVVGKRGIYWGSDVYSMFPCLKEVKQSTTSAENILITAESGGGKSYLAKILDLQLLAMPNFRGTIMDIEGDEYVPLASYVGVSDSVVVLNMGEGSGMYYDPVEIILTGNPDLDADMYGISSAFTLSMFKTLLWGGVVKEASGSLDDWLGIIVHDAVAQVYWDAGVRLNDRATWELSRGLTLHDVYRAIKSLRLSGGSGLSLNTLHSNSLYTEMGGSSATIHGDDVARLKVSNEDYQRAIDLCVARLSPYFEDAGVRSGVFGERISIDAIKSSKLVVCSFGMRGRAENTVDPVQMSLMQLYASNISHLRSIFSRADGCYNFKVWEEFQRWGGFPDADKTINVALTGGRKLGDVNIVITNNIRSLLDNDQFGIFANLTSFAIGCIRDAETRQLLCHRLGIAMMIPELDLIARNNKDVDKYIDGDTLASNPFAKSFLLGLDFAMYTIARVTLPSELRSSKIFHTGVERKDV